MAPLNVEHFNKIIKHIDENILRLWMPSWGVKENPLNGAMKFAECGTACCFGGWSHVLAHPARKNQFNSRGDLRDFDPGNEQGRLGLTLVERGELFKVVRGTRRHQWAVVKQRLRDLIAARVANGEESAVGIKVPR